MREAQRRGAPLLPSTASTVAIMQCLVGGREERNSAASSLRLGRAVPKEKRGTRCGRSPSMQALAIPPGAWGPKITIDSATLMNKGVEVIGVHQSVVAVPLEQIEVGGGAFRRVSCIRWWSSGWVSHCAIGSRPIMRVRFCMRSVIPERLSTHTDYLDLARMGSWRSNSRRGAFSLPGIGV
jgi:1-deoxy-D-xylulose-5-phosphate reductoisomerase